MKGELRAIRRAPAGQVGSTTPAQFFARPKARRPATVDNYVFLVSFVEEDDCFFLKTIIPSRKATRDYLNQGEPDAED